MNTLEKKLLSKVDQHLPFLVVFFVSILGALIRISMRGIVSGDATYALLPWFDAIAENGLYEQVGDYNLLYQFLIWIMTKVPLNPLYSYKALSCLFDYLLAIGAALLARQIDSTNNRWTAIWTYTAVLLCPVVFMNSAGWAQCDSIFTAFAIWGLYFLEKRQYNRSLISLGISFAFKLHAVFILPVYLFVYFSRREFSIVRFLLVPLTMVVVSSPAVFWGRGLFEPFSIYLSQTHTYSEMALNYPSFWTLVCSVSEFRDYQTLKTAAILFTVGILAVIMVVWKRGRYTTTGQNLIALAIILSYSCVLFLPAMHDRYGYLYEMCAIILAVLLPKTLPLCLSLLLISLHSYSAFLFGVSVNFTFLTVVNMAVFVAYLYVLIPVLRTGDDL